MTDPTSAPMAMGVTLDQIAEVEAMHKRELRHIVQITRAALDDRRAAYRRLLDAADVLAAHGRTAPWWWRWSRDPDRRRLYVATKTVRRWVHGR